MQSFDPSVVPHSLFHRLLVGGVAPRPIALVSTMDKAGNSNLSPFSFFNAFGVNPAVICFSPAYAGKTGLPKHTMLNLDETKECTVSIVTYEMVHQISLASAPYGKEVDEFDKSGLTRRPSVKVKPPGVAESPFIMEARLLHHLEFGRTPGSANMMVCEVVMMHVREEVMNEGGGVDPEKMDQVARMGGPYYTRAKEGLFLLPQPTVPFVGIDRLPEEVRNSSILTGKHLAQLASLPELPEFNVDPTTEAIRHAKAKAHLDDNEIDEAWRTLRGE